MNQKWVRMNPKQKNLTRSTQTVTLTGSQHDTLCKIGRWNEAEGQRQPFRKALPHLHFR